MQNISQKIDNSIKRKIVTRFSPSPSGYLHIGGIRTALYNYLFAKKYGGTFYLRIEDTDQKRFVKEAEDYIKQSLKWFGIEPDHSPWNPLPHIGAYRQSERDYSLHIKTLIDNGSAYYAFDTEDEIKLIRESNPHFAYDAKNRMNLRNSLSLSSDDVNTLLSNGTPYVIRFKVPEDTIVIVDDLIRGQVSLNTNQTDDKVLVKSNGIPTYHMANVCDDHDMGTTHVIRGEEWLPSAPLHLMLYQAFGWEAPVFAHLPLILNPDGKGKLSKRKALNLGIPAFPFGGEGEDDKGKKVKYLGFKDLGYDADAVLNFLLLLGWSSSDSKELMQMEEMISSFSLDRVHKSGARFDMDKAKWFNQSYLNTYRKDEELLKHIEMGSIYKYSSEKLTEIIDLCKKRSVFKHDLQVVADIFFKDVILSDKDKQSGSLEFKTIFSNFIKNISNIDWNHDNIKNHIFNLCKENNIKVGKVMPSLRVALTGNVPGPDLMTTMDILGKNETVKRIKTLL